VVSLFHKRLKLILECAGKRWTGKGLSAGIFQLGGRGQKQHPEEREEEEEEEEEEEGRSLVTITLRYVPEARIPARLAPHDCTRSI